MTQIRDNGSKFSEKSARYLVESNIGDDLLMGESLSTFLNLLYGGKII